MAHGGGRGLFLFENFRQARTLSENGFGRIVQFRAELTELRHFAVVREVETNLSAHLFHRFALCGAAYTGDGKSDVDGGTHARTEQLAFEINLSVRNGNDVRGDIGGDVSRESLDDRQSGQRAAAQLFGEFRAPFEKSRMDIEYVSG